MALKISVVPAGSGWAVRSPSFENEMMFVVKTVMELTPLGEDESKQRTMEAHETGVALLLVTHKERAELYQEQFKSKSLTVTIEPAE